MSTNTCFKMRPKVIWYQNFNIILLRVKCYYLEHHGDNLKQIETPQGSCSKMVGAHPGVKLKLGFDMT